MAPKLARTTKPSRRSSRLAMRYRTPFQVHVQELPPELFNAIKDLVFTVRQGSHWNKTEIDENSKPPAQLQVSRATRQQFAASYFSRSYFVFNRSISMFKWLFSLEKTHCQMITKIVRNSHYYFVNNNESHCVDEEKSRRWEFYHRPLRRIGVDTKAFKLSSHHVTEERNGEYILFDREEAKARDRELTEMVKHFCREYDAKVAATD